LQGFEKFLTKFAQGYCGDGERQFLPPGVALGTKELLIQSRGKNAANKHQTNNAAMPISQQDALARQAGTRSQCLKRDNQMV
jgi:hypothetical protein